jgi:hypothetical protein
MSNERAGIQALGIVERTGRLIDAAERLILHAPREGTMRALIVYESMYGNTRAIAEAIAEGWGEGAEVRHVRAAKAPSDEIDLLVVGGPTHIHGMTTSLSRQMAVNAAHEDEHVEIEPDAVDAPGLCHWLRELPHDPGRNAAAFDTRLDRSPGMTGTAARGIAKRLRHRDYLVGWTASFLVDDSEGPLVEGEFDRARTWGASLRTAAAAPPATARSTGQDAAVAAGDMLTQVREGAPPGEAKTAGLPRL